MDERYSAIPGAARKKHTGGPRLIIPRTFESNRRLIISRFFPLPIVHHSINEAGQRPSIHLDVARETIEEFHS